MKVCCPICKSEMDGMKAYGRKSNCCSRNCHDEWIWREALAILSIPYYPRVLDNFEKGKYHENYEP